MLKIKPHRLSHSHGQCALLVTTLELGIAKKGIAVLICGPGLAVKVSRWATGSFIRDTLDQSNLLP